MHPWSIKNSVEDITTETWAEEEKILYIGLLNRDGKSRGRDVEGGVGGGAEKGLTKVTREDLSPQYEYYKKNMCLGREEDNGLVRFFAQGRYWGERGRR